METKIKEKDGVKVVTVFYSDFEPVENWTEIFEQAANKYGLAVDDRVKFVAVPWADL